METYNKGDEIIFVVGKYVFYHAQVIKDKGNMVNIIIKESTWNERDFMYDKEMNLTKDRIVEKTYDAKTDKYLAEQN